MHNIDLRTHDVRLPAEIKVSRTCKFLIRDLPDETDDPRPVFFNDSDDPLSARRFFPLMKLGDDSGRPIDDVDKSVIINLGELPRVDLPEFLVVSQIFLVLVDRPRSSEKIPEHLIV